jgi:ABC-2 type transport system permease protein
MKNLLFLTPFPYQLYFPISVYMGKVNGAGIWEGLLVQGMWVLLAYGAARFMWRRGVKKYSAFGG